MGVETIELPKKYHGAVEHWRRHNFKDYELLMDDWEKYFPTDEKFCLCAKMEVGTPDVIQIGEQKGEKKRIKPDELIENQAMHLFAIIKAQASTEFGSIQQHAGTVDRAPEDEDKLWTMRVMAEELRHGYQMLHLLLSEDWSHVSGGITGEQMVEEILSMTEALVGLQVVAEVRAEVAVDEDDAGGIEGQAGGQRDGRITLRGAVCVLEQLANAGLFPGLGAGGGHWQGVYLGQDFGGVGPGAGLQQRQPRCLGVGLGQCGHGFISRPNGSDTYRRTLPVPYRGLGISSSDRLII